MPYVTGAVNSMADLLAAIRTACTANGWTLSGDVLHKGTCYARVAAEAFNAYGTPPATGYLSVRAGNGIDGSNALTDAAIERAWIGYLSTTFAYPGTWGAWAWPVEYHIHVQADPDEVWVFVRYNTDYLQWLAFGQSGAPGNAGTGNWHAASVARYGNLGNGDVLVDRACNIAANGANNGIGYQPSFCPLPFWWFGNADSRKVSQNSAVHGAIDAATGSPVWSSNDGYLGAGNTVGAAPALTPLLGRIPSLWNSEAVLLPIQIIQARASAKVSLLAELQHARLTRNDYIEPAGIVTLGGDRWKVYPAYRRNLGARVGGVPSYDSIPINHSGTFAIAVRYDGP